MADTKKAFFSTQFADSLAEKKVLFVVAHQDDEVLFAGGLLSQLKAKLSILCMHKSYENRKRPEEFQAAFLRVCEQLRAKAFNGLFEAQKAKFMGGKVFEYAFKCAVMVRYLARYHGYDAVITHNAIGEYGHVDHVIVHYACRVAFRKGILYSFGTGLAEPYVRVDYDVAKKKKLVDEYKSCWTPDGYPFCYKPETFLRLE
jgi:LmbE family N-acetylglucosaminyl deacetylase